MIFFMLGALISPLFVQGEASGLYQGSYKKEEIIVKFKKSERIFKVSLPQGSDIDKEIEIYKNNNSIDFAEPNYIYKASVIPSDTHYDKQWYLKKIQAEKAWDSKRKSPEITIAIIDSGVQIDHPDLRENIWQNKKEIPGNFKDDDGNGFIDDVNGWDFVNNTSNPSPKFSKGFTRDGILHGTIVAGVAAAAGNNATGVVGVSWSTKIMSLKALGDDGQGDTNNVVRAIDYAINNEAHIINLSFVGFGYSQALYDAIYRAHRAGVIIVAAAGNETENQGGILLDKTPIYPVCHDGNGTENMVIGVAATDALDQKATFSGYGNKCIDISAPGVSIFTTSVYKPEKNIGSVEFNEYYEGYWSGTSLAVPIVSGSISLMLASNPSLKSEDINRIFQNTSDNINKLNPEYIGKLGSGRINLYRALSMSMSERDSNTFELLVSPASDYAPEVLITDLKGVKKQKYFAYDKNFRGGVNVAAGDVDGDGVDEIITGAGPGGGPHVRIFNSQGELKNHFFAYDKNFRGGVNVAAGDVSHSSRLKKDEIITAPGPGGGPHIRIYSSGVDIIGEFFAYNKKFKGGVNVAAGDVDGDGVDEIITGAGPGGGPHVRIFRSNSVLIGSFYGYESSFSGGVKVGTLLKN